jgi:hypothetical protein
MTAQYSTLCAARRTAQLAMHSAPSRLACTRWYGVGTRLGNAASIAVAALAFGIGGAAWAAPAAAAAGQANAAQDSEQTLILIRHAEKPAAGLGQLSCQGLNRSLALPAVLLAKYGKPDFMFAPDPGGLKVDDGHSYNYVRPLATIEPSAVRFGLPVYTPFGYLDIDKLRQQLEQPMYRNARIVIAWEHSFAERLARNEVQAYGGNPSSVPKWPGDDFDRIYVLKIHRSAQGTTVDFALDQQGLNQQSSTCPGAPAQP